MKGIVQQEDITILNIYALNVGTPKVIKETILSVKEQLGPDRITMGDFNTPFLSIDRISRQKLRKMSWN
jgi:hypothetical protein